MPVLVSYSAIVVYVTIFSGVVCEPLLWLGHVFRMPNDRLPKKLLFGQV